MSSSLQRQFEALVDQHYASIWAYVSALTRHAVEAEDITHQAFLIAFDRLTTDQPIVEPLKWLRGTVRNLVKAWWREKKRLPLELAEQLAQLAGEADDSQSDVQAEREEALHHCLELLHDDDRRFVHARYEKGMRITQIAQHERLNEATARVRLFRIRQALKDCVEATVTGGFV